MLAEERWTVDFWLDPSCPLAWLTARWIRTVAEHRPVDVHRRVMSLSVLNEGKEADPEGDEEGYLWFPARVCAVVQTEHGHEALGRFHHALWTAEGGDAREWLDDLNRALARAGLPEGLADTGSENGTGHPYGWGLGHSRPRGPEDRPPRSRSAFAAAVAQGRVTGRDTARRHSAGAGKEMAEGRAVGPGRRPEVVGSSGPVGPGRPPPRPHSPRFLTAAQPPS